MKNPLHLEKGWLILLSAERAGGLPTVSKYKFQTTQSFRQIDTLHVSGIPSMRAAFCFNYQVQPLHKR